MKRFHTWLVAALLLGGSLAGAGTPQGDVSTNAPIRIKYENADVREVLRALFRPYKVNYTLDPELRSNVSVDRRFNSLEEALVYLQRSAGIVWRKESGVYMIGPRFQDVNATPPIVRQDDHFLYLIVSGQIQKVRKSDTKLVAREPIPLRWYPDRELYLRAKIGPEMLPPPEMPFTESDAPPIVEQDRAHLYLIVSGRIVKLRKSDLKVVANQETPVRWTIPTGRIRFITAAPFPHGRKAA
jgi:hypothetical protein